MIMFSKSRFLNFGRYDYIINKTFYRNISLMTISGCLGIAIIGFLIRWSMGVDYYEQTAAMGFSNRYSRSSNPEDLIITSYFILFFCVLMMAIFAGYTFHNLRNKQGRISELTIPASNLERWSWHLLMSIGGGMLLCLVGVICSDVLNAILNLIVYHGKCNSSITLQVFRDIFFLPKHTDQGVIQFSSNAMFLDLHKTGAAALLTFFIICNFFRELALYIFGNSVKYKYNIILTYIATQVIGTIISIALISVLVSFRDVININKIDTIHEYWLDTAYWLLCLGEIAIGCALLWFSYRFYSKAQITTSLNK